MRIEAHEQARAFTFTDDDVVTALVDGCSDAQDVVRHLRVKAGLPPGPVTESQRSRAAWALRRLRDEGRVKQERAGDRRGDASRWAVADAY